MRTMKLFEAKRLLRENIAKAKAELKEYEEKEEKFINKLIQEQKTLDEKVMKWFHDKDGYIGLIQQVSDTEVQITGFYGGEKEYRDVVIFTLIVEEF